MTNQSHTELAARLREAHDLSLDGKHFDARVAVLEVVVALESPERVLGEAIGFTPPSDCDSRELCKVNRRCAGRYNTKAICPTPPTAPAQDAQALGYATLLAQSMWERRFREVAPDWKPLPDLVGVLTQIDNMIAGMLSATPSPQAERMPMSDEQVETGRQEWLYSSAVPNSSAFICGVRYAERAHGIVTKESST